MLDIGKFFYRSLISDEDIKAATDGRIYPTARTMEEEKADRIPYIIIISGQSQNNLQTKDEFFEGQEDNDSVELTIVAATQDALVTLAQQVRNRLVADARLRLHQDDLSGKIDDWHFASSRIEYDPLKPCHFISFTYNCETTNH